MLRRLLLNRTTTNWPIVIQKCRLSSDNSYQTTLMAVLGNMWRSGKGKFFEVHDFFFIN